MANFSAFLQQLQKDLEITAQENVELHSYSTARVGGPARGIITVYDKKQLEVAVRLAWQSDIQFLVMGSGANLLISDKGYDGVVILNKANLIRVNANDTPPTVWGESGANFSLLARRAALRGLSGLEWAAAIPGTVGGAVYGNAGAFGSDVSRTLLLAEILHPTLGIQTWKPDQFEYGYRTSILKRNHNFAVLLSAQFLLQPASVEEAKAKIEENTAKRRATQPPGASLGSMFKNPEGDYAGRLIEAAGLKGKRFGGVAVSEVHANFFVNDEGAKAQDYWNLIQYVKQDVKSKFDVELELEVEPIGDFS
ncbi:MAG TPA: UDP-N-acetylmuramate dehydrogenase [Bellilinea sp.]|nr:UDP-N-acetylmuramate dehydrogenase [Bellilinea sp.]